MKMNLLQSLQKSFWMVGKETCPRNDKRQVALQNGIMVCNWEELLAKVFPSSEQRYSDPDLLSERDILSPPMVRQKRSMLDWRTDLLETKWNMCPLIPWRRTKLSVTLRNSYTPWAPRHSSPQVMSADSCTTHGSQKLGSTKILQWDTTHSLAHAVTWTRGNHHDGQAFWTAGFRPKYLRYYINGIILT